MGASSQRQLLRIYVISGLPGSTAAVDLRERRDVRNLLHHVARPARHSLVLPRQEHDRDIQGGEGGGGPNSLPFPALDNDKE